VCAKRKVAPRRRKKKSEKIAALFGVSLQPGVKSENTATVKTSPADIGAEWISSKNRFYSAVTIFLCSFDIEKSSAGTIKVTIATCPDTVKNQ